MIDIDNLLQGGDGGLQVLVSYLPGGGDHATTKLVKWMVEGVDGDFPTAPRSTPAATRSDPSSSATW